MTARSPEAGAWPNLYPGTEVRIFDDNDKSASNPEVFRPKYNDLLGAIRRGEIRAVIAHEQSQLTRQPSEWDELVVTLTKAGIGKVHTVQQGVIGVEPGNRVVGRIMNILDAEESERIKARSAAMAEQLAQEGRPQGGRFYGYRRKVLCPDGKTWVFLKDDGRPRLEIVPEEETVVLRIVDELLAGHSARAVAERLNAAEFRHHGLTRSTRQRKSRLPERKRSGEARPCCPSPASRTLPGCAPTTAR